MTLHRTAAVSFLIALTLTNNVNNAFAPASVRPRRPLICRQSKQNLQEDTEVKQQSRFGFDVPSLPSLEFNPKGSTELITEESISSEQTTATSNWSYAEFAKAYPNVNNIGIATIKTASADLLAQVVIAQTPVSEIDWQRAFLFCAFGALYLGAFQYWYQVNIFKRLFDVDKFTSQPWAEKLKDKDGLISLGAQTAVDLTVLTLIYLPTF